MRLALELRRFSAAGLIYCTLNSVSSSSTAVERLSSNCLYNRADFMLSYLKGMMQLVRQNSEAKCWESAGCERLFYRMREVNAPIWCFLFCGFGGGLGSNLAAMDENSDGRGGFQGFASLIDNGCGYRMGTSVEIANPECGG